MLHAGAGGGQVGFCGLQVFLARGPVAGQLALARELLLGQLAQRLLLGQLGAQARQRGTPRIHRGALHAGVDLHQQCALLHLGAGLHAQPGDLARHLGAHVHIAARLQRADGRDGGLDIGARHGLGLVGHGRPAGPPGGRAPGRRQQDHRHGDGFPALLRARHACLPTTHTPNWNESRKLI
ncbi:conserved hypothetical protein [Ricinus communis]|uniref:Uncharacterized protein n=1 Tax=Ricinus communis TaxID=3988 RepID=B9THA0_RICCO|nr:conserved hypothetical protein [Ricinus communis]